MRGLTEGIMHSYRHDKSMTIRLMTLGLLASLISGAAFADADAPTNWQAQPYAYRVIDQDVRSVLTEFGRNLGMPVIVSRHVAGKVRGDISADTAGEFLARIASINGLLWYQDGSALIVDREADLGSRSYDVRGLDDETLHNTLAGLSDGASPLISSRMANDGLLVVSGPPGYLDRVGQRVDALRPVARGGSRGTAQGVRVFRGGAQTEVVSDRS